jgi:hypothetical protein
MCPAYRLSPFHGREVASLRALKSTLRGACHPVRIAVGQRASLAEITSGESVR